MSVQYWVGGFFIDLSRNQITQNEQSQTIAPKALSVLTYLAEHRGKVISHDELLENVWEGTVVSPNTLQRSIAQLRKALGDDGKIYIKTHAKQGYSLECDVRWHGQEGVAPAREATNAATNQTIDSHTIDIHIATPVNVASTKSDGNSAPTTYVKRLIFAFFAIVIVSIVGANLVISDATPNLSFGELRLLTTTDNRELASIYSPDGQYVVFHRYSEEFCLNNIWAKNLNTQEEFQLTSELDSYGSHSFSKDGNKLAFIISRDCVAPTSQKKCYVLMTLDFHKAIVSPQRPTELIECKNSVIRSPVWLNNDNIALLQKTAERWTLISYSPEDDTSDIIYSLEDGNIIDYDYSAKEDLIALTSVRSDGLYYIEILSSEGVLLSSNKIEYPDEIAPLRYVYPNFSPYENQLIFSTGRQLFTLSYEGHVDNVSLPLDSPMGTPVFHPSGGKMLVIKGHYDSDIASISIEHLMQKDGDLSESADYEVLERSILRDYSARKQANGSAIAYLSGRSGETQVWLFDGNQSQQLTHFPLDTNIYGMDWATDGNSLLVNVDHQLVQVSLDGTQHSIPFEYPLDSLLQWDSNEQTALINLRINGVLAFAELNLRNSQMRIIKNERVDWAYKNDEGNLIYIDHMDRFWLSGALEDQRIQALDDQGSDKRFVVKNDIIYGVNEDFELWSYSLNDSTFNIIAKLPTNVDYLTDIDDSQLLITIRDSARKEVAELSLK
ncbi:winged helix-turn-helix domain-containing protein [Agaribacter marinus]|uniref:OmpR/PhoB-type domain-containing protein n=1 Tax=Agaribacter marinus TaxID=1431249 RepID=A0AA37WHW8_9ALTE|nr:winged helix-turn-helix domain-containing protein [Agaribacter marinus]GLR71566.1 hypothetical protein GCM10007852_24740 [Agaribacter marinus]